MKRTIFIVLITVSISAFAQERINITLQVEAPTLSDSESVYVAGNTLELGNWNPDKVVLVKFKKNLWRKTFQFSKGMTIEYKFTKGSWATEALGSDSSVPQNSVLVINRDTTVLVTIFNWRDKFNFKVKGQITGTVKYHKNFILDDLKPCDIFVWLPPDYETNIKKRYPVFYMHDGQNLVDSRTSNTFIDWQVDEAAWAKRV